MSTTTLLIADDHPLFRSALRAAVGQVLPEAQVIEADSLAGVLEALNLQPDVDLVLLDLRMPGAQGFSSLIELRGQFPATPVAIVSAEEEPASMRRAIDFGATGFIPKSASLAVIGTALREMLDGTVWLPPGVLEDDSDEAAAERELVQRISSLTPQQFRVLMALADGRLNKQIGGDLNVTEATVKAHVTAILRKLGLYRRTQAAVLAQRLLKSEAGGLRIDDARDGSDPELGEG